jgi:hypothetical protein
VPAVIWRPAARLIGGNKLFAVALIPALLLRVDAELGYRWQVWFNDSFSYLITAVKLTPDAERPSGYPVFLWLLSPFRSYLLVTALQHLMGLAVAVMIYALARHRFRAPAWLAVLATLPVLYDGFEIQLEHLILTDTLFLFLAMAAVTVVLWSPRPSWRACLLAGLLLGLSALVRSTGLPLVVVFVVYLLIRLLPGAFRAGDLAGGRRAGWLRLVAGLAACAVAFAVPVLGYEGWYKQAHGRLTMTDSTGIFLYSRVMTFADCSRMSLPTDLLSLCTTVPPAQRPVAQAYIWTEASPLDRFPAPKFTPTVDKLAEQFAIKAIEAQPLDYARVVWNETVQSFGWGRPVFPNAATYAQYLFGYHSVIVPPSPVHGYKSAAAYYVRGNPDTSVVDPFATAIRVYQRYVWLPGTVYGLILLAALAGMLWPGRKRSRAGRPGRVAALLPWLSSLALIVVPAATAEFDYRYVTTAVPFGCLALALAFGRARSADFGVTGVAVGAVDIGAVDVGDAVGGTGASGEPGGTAGLPRRVPGSGLRGGLANAGNNKRDLPADPA